MLQPFADVIVFVVSLLDALPDACRAILSAAVLGYVVVETSKHISSQKAGFGLAYRKTALFSLLAIPLTIYFVLDLRLVLMVEEMPSYVVVPDIAALIVTTIWCLGFVGKLGWRVISDLKQKTDFELTPLDEKLALRVERWQSRMGDVDVEVFLGGVDEPTFIDPNRLVLPQAAGRWDRGVQDAVLLHSFAVARLSPRLWYWVAEVVSAMYWPIVKLRLLRQQIVTDIQFFADVKAIAYYKDRLGYSRALRYVGQFVDSLSIAGKPPSNAWGGIDALNSRAELLLKSEHAEPHYDRVFWALMQATLTVFLLTGTTLGVVQERKEVNFMKPWEWNRITLSNEYAERPLETKR